MTLTSVTVQLGGRDAPFPCTLTAEQTECPHIVITPSTDGEVMRGGWNLTHVPSGRRLPTGFCSEGYLLRQIVKAVAHLDWSSPDLEDYQTGGRLAANSTAIAEAVRTTEASEAPKVDEEPPGPNDIPRDALGITRMMLDSAQRLWDRTSGADHIPIDLPAEEGEKHGKPNPEWMSAIKRFVDAFGLAYLSAALHRVDPAAADSAARWLADQWDGGDTLGEWLWEWRQQVAAGEPLRLPGVPTPAAAVTDSQGLF